MAASSPGALFSGACQHWQPEYAPTITPVQSAGLDDESELLDDESELLDDESELLDDELLLDDESELLDDESELLDDELLLDDEPLLDDELLPLDELLDDEQQHRLVKPGLPPLKTILPDCMAMLMYCSPCPRESDR
jgi:hypothetical protein